MRFLKDPLNAFSVLLLSGAVLLQFATPLRAQDAEEAVPEIITEATEEDTKCLEEISETTATLTKDIIDFLNEHYKSEEPNSTLIDGALEKYDEYRERMIALVNQFGGAQGGRNIISEYDEREGCQNMVDDQILSVAQLMVNHNVQTAGGKKSHKLVTKLKEVNEKLRGLNRDFGEMYGGFKAFVDKLQNTVK